MEFADAAVSAALALDINNVLTATHGLAFEAQRLDTS